MTVIGFVHPVDTTIHTTVPPGWRWAVHIGANPYEVRQCVQAGWSPTSAAAHELASIVIGAVVQTLKRGGALDLSYRLQDLDHDPIPAGGDEVRVV